MRNSLLMPALGAAALLSAPLLAGDATPLVDSAWVASNLGNENVVILDIRRDVDDGSVANFDDSHIPGAVHADYSAAGWRVERDGVIGMLPEVGDLEALIGGLGIDNDDHVVVVHPGFSSSDFGSATRVYWTFKVLGHEDVSILDGGFAAWSGDAANPVEAGASAAEAAVFTADFQPQLLATKEEVQAAISSGGELLIDARPAAQFTGAEKAGPVARAGTLPGAVNLQQQLLVNADSQSAIDEGSLDALMSDLKIPTKGEQVAFCNTGHWASIAWFAVSEIGGNKQASMYDGSMTEWAADTAGEMVTTAN